MFTIPHVDFYITNVCNLTCRGCNRFNNLGLKGFQRWSDHAAQIETWATRLNFGKITIIGGEPTLNLDLENWCSNLRRLWPDTEIMIQTNGTYQKEKYLTFWSKYKIAFVISGHDKELENKIKNDWKEAFFIDATVFHQNALLQHDNFYTVHKSNPEAAFIACGMKHDVTFFNGKLYKCPVTALLPEVYKQKDVRLSQKQLHLMLSYMPLSSNCSDEQLAAFINARDSHIPNCEFCPENLKWHTALGELKENLPPHSFE